MNIFSKTTCYMCHLCLFRSTLFPSKSIKYDIFISNVKKTLGWPSLHPSFCFSPCWKQGNCVIHERCAGSKITIHRKQVGQKAKTVENIIFHVIIVCYSLWNFNKTLVNCSAIRYCNAMSDSSQLGCNLVHIKVER